MADFISFETEVESESDLLDSDDEIDENADDFIVSDENVMHDSRNFYRQFHNVENEIDEILKESRNEALKDIEEFDEISNLDDDEEGMDVDDFDSSKEYIKKFEKTLLPESDNQICNVLIKAFKFKKKRKNLNKNLIQQINQREKIKFIVDHQYFFDMCHKLTMILSQFGYFLCVYELKKKFRYLTMKKPEQQKIVKQLLSCLIEKFNGFSIVRLDYEKKVRQKFEPVDIIYKPTKNIEIELLCYFSINFELAYTAYYTKNSENIRSFKVRSCHYCNHYFVHNKKKFDRHLKHCTGKPGIIYDFNNQLLISYEDNFNLREICHSAFILILKQQHQLITVLTQNKKKCLSYPMLL